MYCAIDVGSTTCKYVLCNEAGERRAQDYRRHNTRQAEAVLEFLTFLETRHGLSPGRDRVFLTGSGAGPIAPLVGGRAVQEVVAVAAAVEARHPGVRFVSEIGGEDMKTLFFSRAARTSNKQVYMQSACSGGTGAFIEKTARKLRIPLERLSQMRHTGYTLHKISSKCGIFAETDANTLLKSGVPVEEIIASLFEAVVYQNLATLTKGNTPHPEVLLLGGPNRFFTGLQEAWRHHLTRLWEERATPLPNDAELEQLIRVPADALYYAALGCVEVAKGEPEAVGLYRGHDELARWVSEGQHAQKHKESKQALCSTPGALEAFRSRYAHTLPAPRASRALPRGQPVVVGCDFGSSTAKAVCISPDKEVVFTCYALSEGNPIEDTRRLLRRIEAVVADEDVIALGITGYGKDLLRDIIGADCAVVETVAHASAGLHWFPDADCICDVGGTDVKIMILRNGTVADFRLNSQCSSGNGAFLQGAAETFGIALDEIAERAFSARSMPSLTMGCGVFLQSDIVNQQRKGWQAEEILAGLCAILPRNVWIYAGGLNNLSQVGRRYILQGGTHKNLAVVKAQVDFIRSKIHDAEVVVHPYSGEAGAIGAGFIALEHWQRHRTASRFRGFEALERLTYRTTTSPETKCGWCEVGCQRSFVDVEIAGAPGRPWSKVALAPGWQRIIVNNSCPKGLIEDAREVKAAKSEVDRVKHEFPNIAQLVQRYAFRAQAA